MPIDAIVNRRSVRHYIKDDIPEESLKEILEAGRLAPSACNKQNWKFIVVDDKLLKKELALACRNQEGYYMKFVEDASVLIIGCATNTCLKMVCGDPTYPIDIAIALDHMSLQASAMGLGSCWIGAFYPDEIKRIIGIPEYVKIIILMTIGIPEKEYKHTKRKPLSEIICFNKYSF